MENKHSANNHSHLPVKFCGNRKVWNQQNEIELCKIEQEIKLKDLLVWFIYKRITNKQTRLQFCCFEALALFQRK